MTRAAQWMAKEHTGVAVAVTSGPNINSQKYSNMDGRTSLWKDSKGAFEKMRLKQSMGEVKFVNVCIDKSLDCWQDIVFEGQIPAGNLYLKKFLRKQGYVKCLKREADAIVTIEAVKNGASFDAKHFWLKVDPKSPRIGAIMYCEKLYMNVKLVYISDNKERCIIECRDKKFRKCYTYELTERR